MFSENLLTAVKFMIKRNRIIYAVLFAVLLITEVVIALFVHDRIIRPYIGDVLVTLLLCALIRSFIPDKIRFLAVYVSIFSVFVEVGQYFNYVKLLGLSDIKFFSILMGTSFSWIDIICYAVGCLIFFVIEITLKRNADKLR